MSKTQAQGLLGDINGLVPRIGTYLISFVNNPVLSNGVHPYIQLSESVFSTVDALGAEAFFNYLDDNKKRDFVNNLQKNKGEYTKHLSSEEELRKFNYQITKVEAAVNGYSLAPSKLDDLEPDDKKVLKHVLETAIMHCSGKNPSGYADAIIAEANKLLKERQDIKPEVLKQMQETIAKGRTKKSTLVLDDDNKNTVSASVVRASEQIAHLFGNPSEAFDFASEQVKSKIIKVAQLIPEEAEKLSVMLDNVKYLWSLGGDNLYDKKTAYLNNPPSLLSSKSAEDAFVKISLSLCNSSSAEQINKLSSVYPVVEWYKLLTTADKNKERDPLIKQELLEASLLILTDKKAVISASNKEKAAQAVVAGYDIISAAMKAVGGRREYPERNKLMATLLPQLAKMDPQTLESKKEEITKLCAKAINQNSSRSWPFMGNNTVTVKSGGIDKMSEALKNSLSTFMPNAPAIDRPVSLPAGMPIPTVQPVVDRSKAVAKVSLAKNTPVQRINSAPAAPEVASPPARRKAVDARDVVAEDVKRKFTSRPPTTPRPARLESHRPKQARAEVVNKDSLERWEASELRPAGMPPPPQQKVLAAPSDKSVNPVTPHRPLPPAPNAVRPVPHGSLPPIPFNESEYILKEQMPNNRPLPQVPAGRPERPPAGPPLGSAQKSNKSRDLTR